MYNKFGDVAEIYTKEKHSMKKFVLLTCIALMALTGCTCKKIATPAGTKIVEVPGKTIIKEVKVPGKVVIKEVVKYRGGGGGCDTCSLVRLTPEAPAEAVVGQGYASTAKVEALTDAGNVHVYTVIPEGVQYVSSEPSASVNGNRLMWNYPLMKSGDVKDLKVNLKSNREGDVRLCYVITADPVYCVNTKIGSPKLEITKTGPQVAELNSTITYNITIKNTGTAVARNVVIKDPVPNGLQDPNGRSELSFPVGDLAPGESKSVQAPFRAATRGQVCNVANASSSNAGNVTARACTKILKKELTLTCQAPQQGKVGQRVTAKAIITNQGDVELTDATIQVNVCSQAQLISSDCGNVEGSSASWRGTLAPGQSKTCTYVMVSNSEGQCCMRMTASGGGMTKTSECCTNWTGDPKIEITKTGPAEASLNEQISYTVTVRSTGTATAKNVVVVDTLPAGLAHSSGTRTLRTPIGDMPPGSSKTLNIPVTAAAAGRHCNVAKANSSNAGTVQAEACTVVKTRDASVDVTCPGIAYLGKRVRASIVVRNTGDTTLNGVTVNASADPGLKIVSGKNSWNVGPLAAGETKELAVTIISLKPGKHCFKVGINTAEGIRKQAECCTLWKGFPALLLECIDTVDPLIANEETTYVIEVTNQGTAPDHDVKIEAVFPAEVSPVSANGSTACTVSGKRVTVIPYPVLQPKEKIKWQIRAKAVQPGDSRLKVYLTSELLKKPVTEEESTHVY